MIADGPFQYLWKWRSVSHSNKAQPTSAPGSYYISPPQAPAPVPTNRSQTLGEPISQADEKGQRSTSKLHSLLGSLGREASKQVARLHAEALGGEQASVIAQVQQLNTSQTFQETHTHTMRTEITRCGEIIITVIIIAHSRGSAKRCNSD